MLNDKRVTLDAWEIGLRFVEYLRTKPLEPCERELLVDVAIPTFRFWCWLRNDGQAHGSVSCFVDRTRMLGIAKMAQLTKAKDLPEGLREGIREALEKHFPGFDSSPEKLNKWDMELHPQYIKPFADTLG